MKSLIHSRTAHQQGGPGKCRKKFLRYFPDGFRDPKYVAWERGYKEAAHVRWNEVLNRDVYFTLLQEKRFAEIAAQAVQIESRTNLLFSFEKMALRDAVKPAAGSQAFAEGLYHLLHGRGGLEGRFERWCDIVATLPRKQTRVLTWPVATIFGFIAQPKTHFFLKPNVTRRAAEKYGLEFNYESKPSSSAYTHLLELAQEIRSDLSDLKPRDMIDLQSFLWVQGSDEYP
jgi:hypothetical protein